jgi:hypothetical protein
MHKDPNSTEPFIVDAARLWPLAAFTSVYLVGASWLALERGNIEFMLYIGVMLIIIPLVLWVHWRVILNDAVLWGLSFWGLVHMAGGLVVVPEAWPVEAQSRVLYSLWLVPGQLKYDHVVHAYGFGLATWVCWQGLRAAIRHRGGGIATPSIGLMVLSATAGMGLGSLNELIEFVATLTVPETNVGGYVNTGWDLVSNFIGALTAVTLISLHDRYKRSDTASAGSS